MKSSLKNMVMVLALVALISSAAVGGVYVLTKDTITRTNDKKFKDALQTVLPQFESISDGKKVKVEGWDKDIVVYSALTGETVVGYAVECAALGFTEDIKLLVGFNTEGDIQKVAVLSHAETPGLGAKISDPQEKFVVQFEGKNPETFKLSVKKDGGDIDAITASTITSRAYALAVQRAWDAINKLK